MIKILYQLLQNIETNKITYAHRYNLSVHDFQTVSLIIQDFLIEQIMVMLICTILAGKQHNMTLRHYNLNQFQYYT